MDCVSLVGAETVERAAHNMEDAAREMTRAVRDIAEALAWHRRELSALRAENARLRRRRGRPMKELSKPKSAREHLCRKPDCGYCVGKLGGPPRLSTPEPRERLRPFFEGLWRHMRTR